MQGTKPGEDNPQACKKNDIVIKAAFVEWFVDLLRFLYANVDEVFDLARGATAMEKELLEIMPERERRGGTMVADLLMKVYLRDGTEQWILIHLEVEAGSNDSFAESFGGITFGLRINTRCLLSPLPFSLVAQTRNGRRSTGLRCSKRK